MDCANLTDLITEGEHAQLEFKQSFRWDDEHQRVNKKLESVVAKTVAGFLNAGGGRLLIGVADNGAVVGLSRDLATLSHQSHDRLELAMRSAIGRYLGPEISPAVNIEFCTSPDGLTVAMVECKPHTRPVFLKDGDAKLFFVRDGNRTNRLDVQAFHSYIQSRWPAGDPSPTPESETEPSGPTQFTGSQNVEAVVRAAIRAELGRLGPGAMPTTSEFPPWVQIATRRVIDLFTNPLRQGGRWQRLYVVSPWLSAISDGAMSSSQIMQRIIEDRPTVYLVTRPQEEEWHRRAVAQWAETGRVNVVEVPDLHTKLFYAETERRTFALIGSANLTQRSMTNREIGLLVEQTGDGIAILRRLRQEAGDIYRVQGRRVTHRAKFDPI